MDTIDERKEDIPEQVLEESEEILDVTYPEEAEVIAALRRRIPIRPEIIMGIIALLAAALLLATIVVCMPYFQAPEPTLPPMAAGEDPDLLPQRHNSAYETAPPETQPAELEEGETAPTVAPTIPPDPNPYGQLDFQYNRSNYLMLQNLPSSPGIDVSAFQGNIDWQKVAASGIEFAIIRLGYRGYESGKLVEDEYAKANLQGAADAGIAIGAYFFSQALSIREADQEIEFMLEVLGDHDLDMPIILDWEIPAASARTANMDARTLTDIQLHFCQVMEEKGYRPMIYFNWYQSENLYYLHELEDYPFWLALYQDRMTYPWKVEMWQYTCTGRVPGIAGDVDINVYMPN